MLTRWVDRVSVPDVAEAICSGLYPLLWSCASLDLPRQEKLFLVPLSANVPYEFQSFHLSRPDLLVKKVDRWMPSVTRHWGGGTLPSLPVQHYNLMIAKQPNVKKPAIAIKHLLSKANIEHTQISPNNGVWFQHFGLPLHLVMRKLCSSSICSDGSRSTKISPTLSAFIIPFFLGMMNIARMDPFKPIDSCKSACPSCSGTDSLLHFLNCPAYDVFRHSLIASLHEKKIVHTMLGDLQEVPPHFGSKFFPVTFSPTAGWPLLFIAPKEASAWTIIVNICRHLQKCWISRAGQT